MNVFIYYTTRGLKILDYTRRVARSATECAQSVSCEPVYLSYLLHLIHDIVFHIRVL
jgi:hypothetical protein